MIDHEPARSIVLVFHSIPFAHRTHPQIRSRESQLVLSLGLFIPGSAALDGLEKRELFLFPSPLIIIWTNTFCNKSVKKNCNFTRVALQSVPKLFLAWNSLLLYILLNPFSTTLLVSWKSGFKFISCSRGKLASFHHFRVRGIESGDLFVLWEIFAKFWPKKLKSFIFCYNSSFFIEKCFGICFLATFQHRFWVILYLGPDQIDYLILISYSIWV